MSTLAELILAKSPLQSGTLAEHLQAIDLISIAAFTEPSIDGVVEVVPTVSVAASVVATTEPTVVLSSYIEPTVTAVVQTTELKVEVTSCL